MDQPVKATGATRVRTWRCRSEAGLPAAICRRHGGPTATSTAPKAFGAVLLRKDTFFRRILTFSRTSPPKFRRRLMRMFSFSLKIPKEKLSFLQGSGRNGRCSLRALSRQQLLGVFALQRLLRSAKARTGRAARGARTHETKIVRRPLMKKLFPAAPHGRSSSKGTYFRYCCLPIVALLSGCETNQTHWDSMKMREHLDDYYSEEIMDNLIRARNGLPFVHVDIDSLTASVTGKVTGNVGGGQTLTNTGTRAVTNQSVTTDTTSATPSHVVAGTVGVVGTLAHMAMRPFTFSVAPERTDKADVSAKPVVNDPCAYWPYLKFLSLPAAPSASANQPPPSEPRLGTPSAADCSGDDLQLDLSKTIFSVADKFAKPAEGTYVPGTLQKRGKHYYYVPFAYSQAYFDLCLSGQEPRGGKYRE